MAFAATDNGLAVDVTGLTKRYGSFSAVDGVSFSVKKGEFFGLGEGYKERGIFNKPSLFKPPPVREGLLNDNPIYMVDLKFRTALITPPAPQRPSSTGSKDRRSSRFPCSDSPAGWRPWRSPKGVMRRSSVQKAQRRQAAI